MTRTFSALTAAIAVTAALAAYSAPAATWSFGVEAPSMVTGSNAGAGRIRGVSGSDLGSGR